MANEKIKKSFENQLIYGDNLEILTDLSKSPSFIDLVYIDPPYSTGQTFTISDEKSSTISRTDKGSVIAYSDKYTLVEYLNFMRPRIELIKKVLTDKGSLYFHIDNKASHYVKVMLDEIFGIENFRAEITRIKCSPKNFKRRNYGNIKDIIFFYTKTDEYIWNDIKKKVSKKDLEERYNKKDKDGRLYNTVPLHAPGETKNGGTNIEFMGQSPPIGRHWRCSIDKLQEYYDNGLIETSKTGNMRLIKYADDFQYKKVQDIWEYKDPQNAVYPTEKNSQLLDFIIKNSSNENSVVMDCFCGSGTTLLSAIKNKRKFIGIDSSKEAIKRAAKKLMDYREEFDIEKFSKVDVQKYG